MMFASLEKANMTHRFASAHMAEAASSCASSNFVLITLDAIFMASIIIILTISVSLVSVLALVLVLVLVLAVLLQIVSWDTRMPTRIRFA